LGAGAFSSAANRSEDRARPPPRARVIIEVFKTVLVFIAVILALWLLNVNTPF
jgi:hypothetical protein